MLILGRELWNWNVLPVCGVVLAPGFLGVRSKESLFMLLLKTQRLVYDEKLYAMHA